ncbi:hypothetical protein GQ53DRAFT_818410 [Thozetella sp. PMI_491]|nr:hypothetical protein GQ53DRAFT_818410 [Thozetella sp. PMI_491]
MAGTTGLLDAIHEGIARRVAINRTYIPRDIHPLGAVKVLRLLEGKLGAQQKALVIHVWRIEEVLLAPGILPVYRELPATSGQEGDTTVTNRALSGMTVAKRLHLPLQTLGTLTRRAAIILSTPGITQDAPMTAIRPPEVMRGDTPQTRLKAGRGQRARTIRNPRGRVEGGSVMATPVEIEGV